MVLCVFLLCPTIGKPVFVTPLCHGRCLSFLGFQISSFPCDVSSLVAADKSTILLFIWIFLVKLIIMHFLAFCMQDEMPFLSSFFIYKSITWTGYKIQWVYKMLGKISHKPYSLEAASTKKLSVFNSSISSGTGNRVIVRTHHQFFRNFTSPLVSHWCLPLATVGILGHGNQQSL